jgi:23S rRNA (cytidine1920-2'-O)/16S rRNA (cytidine1409-2'-O)-methyltransferase
VIALDVAYGELHWRIRNDPRVTVVERTNARNLDPSELPYGPDLITIDVSFISLAKVLPAVLSTAADRFDCLALVKPQFEVGRERVGKGGVVRDPEDRRAAVAGVARTAQDLGYSVRDSAPSGLPGPAGNIETFVWIAESAP